MKITAKNATVIGIAAACCATPLQAQVAGNWYVYTDAHASAANQSNGYNVQNSATCNGSSANCSSNTGFVGSHSDTVTSAASTASATGVSPDYAWSGNPTGASDSSASARADLSTGQLGIATASSGVGGDATGAAAQATLSDTLLFNLVGATSPVPITVDLHVDGSFHGFVQPRFGFSMTDATHVLSTATVGWSDNTAASATTTSSNFTSFGAPSGDWTSFGPEDFVGTFYVDPTDPLVYLSMYLSAGGAADTSASFNHTAAISFDLPTGVSFTSASGSFLTAQETAGAVPEPGTWAMMLVGFGAVGVAIRRKRSPALASA